MSEDDCPPHLDKEETLMWESQHPLQGMIRSMLRRVSIARAAEAKSISLVEYYQGREKHFVALLGISDGGQYRHDWDGAIENLKKSLDEVSSKARDLIREVDLLTDGHYDPEIRAPRADQASWKYELRKKVDLLREVMKKWRVYE